MATQQQETSQVSPAHQHHRSRLRYEAQLAERQFLRVDPDHRLVAAALEKRWNEALAQLKRVEEAEAHRDGSAPPLLALSEELETAFKAIGRHLPALWRQGLIAQQQQQALLGCLIDKVVVHRPAPEWVQARIVWRGGDATTLKIPVPVGSLTELAGAKEMERLGLQRNAQGVTDEVSASELTAQGSRSPMHPFVLPSPLRGLRLNHRQFLVRHQSHPRRVTGSFTLTQLAKVLDSAPHWIYDRINTGSIQISKDSGTRLYLFPDAPATLEQFDALRAGTLKTIRF